MVLFSTGFIVRLTVMACFWTTIKFRYKAIDGFVVSYNGSKSLRNEF